MLAWSSSRVQAVPGSGRQQVTRFHGLLTACASWSLRRDEFRVIKKEGYASESRQAEWQQEV